MIALRRQIGIVTAIVLLGSGTANAATFCKDIQTLDAQSGKVQMTLPGTENTVTCSRSLMLSGGAQLHCGWPFAYRAAEATQAFDRLVTTVSHCLGEGAKVTADLDVNHPDFYDLQTFQLGGQEIGVSLKDKAALAETYVFLRVTLP